MLVPLREAQAVVETCPRFRVPVFEGIGYNDESAAGRFSHFIDVTAIGAKLPNEPTAAVVGAIARFVSYAALKAKLQSKPTSGSWTNQNWNYQTKPNSSMK